jgi:hypothetical protein
VSGFCVCCVYNAYTITRPKLKNEAGDGDEEVSFYYMDILIHINMIQ